MPITSKKAKAHRVEPIDERRYKIQLTADQSLVNKIEMAKSLISHECTSRDLESVLNQALDLLIEAKTKRKFGLNNKAANQKGRKVGGEDKGDEHSRKENSKAGNCNSKNENISPMVKTRHIPADIRREVYFRDYKGGCTFVSADGQRCGSKHRLEFHHIHPFGKEGTHSVENLTLYCQSHNQFEGRKEFPKAYLNLEAARHSLTTPQRSIRR